MSFTWKEVRCRDNQRLEEATRITPIYYTCIGHTQNVTDVEECEGKNFPGVRIPYSADWYVMKLED